MNEHEYRTQADAVTAARLEIWGTTSASECEQLSPAPVIAVTIRGRARFIHFDNFGRVQFVADSPARAVTN